MIVLEKKIRIVIFDMDGVIYRIGEILPGVLELMENLLLRGVIPIFFTNNSTRTRKQYVDLLATIGIHTEEGYIFTSAALAASSMQQLYPKGTIFVIGEEGLFIELKNRGLKVITAGKIGDHTPDQKCDIFISENEIPGTQNIHVPKIDAVVVGWDRSVSYGKFRWALHFLNNGAQFVATNIDLTFPAPTGIWPGNGASVKYLEFAFGHPPSLIFGKPFTEGFQKILTDFECMPSDAIMIGDRLETDIRGAKSMGIKTVLVETGVHTRDDFDGRPRTDIPDFVIEDLTEISFE